MTESYDWGTGFDESPQTVIKYSDPTLQMIYPFAFNGNFTDSYFSSYEYKGMLTHRRGTITVNADAWGTVTTPEGTYNALRVKSIRDEVDSVWISGFFISATLTTLTDYGWYTTSSKIPVFALTVIETAQTSDTVGYYSTQTIGVPEQSIAGACFSIYPNPATDFITVVFKNNVSAGTKIRVLNQLGQEVKRITAGSLTGETLQIDLDGLTPGVYFIRINDETSSYVQRFVKR